MKGATVAARSSTQRPRSEEHTSELQSQSHISYAVFCLKKKKKACRSGLEDADYAWGNEPPNQMEYFQGEWTGPKRVCLLHATAYADFYTWDYTLSLRDALPI